MVLWITHQWNGHMFCMQGCNLEWLHECCQFQHQQPYKAFEDTSSRRAQLNFIRSWGNTFHVGWKTHMRSALLLTFGPPMYGTCLCWVCTLDGHSIAINICPWKCSKQANKFHQYVLRELFSRLQDFGCLNLFLAMTVKIDKERMFYGSHSLQGFTWAYNNVSAPIQG